MTEADEMGPIDWILIEWPGQQPSGEAVPHLLDLVDRGLVRIIDIAFIAKDDDGNTVALDLSAVPDEFDVFDGASADVIDDDDVADAAAALDNGTSAALIMWENSWAAPFASAIRRNGGEVVASGRIPVAELAAALGD